MELKFLVLFFGIIIPILLYFFEAWGIYELEPFAYKIGIRIKKYTFKNKVKTFDKLNKSFYRVNNINYKFISNNICLIRFGSEKIPLFMYLRPIPLFTYKIVINDNRYILILKLSLFYLFPICFLIYKTITMLFFGQKISFDDLKIILYFMILCGVIIVVSIRNMKKIAINFLKIIRNN